MSESGFFRKQFGGFTLIELLVVMAIISLLLTMVAPSIQRARNQAMRVACAQNLRPIGIGMLEYAGDHDGWFPPPRDLTYVYFYWAAVIYKYYGVPAHVFRCPKDRTERGINGHPLLHPPTQRFYEVAVSYVSSTDTGRQPVPGEPFIFPHWRRGEERVRMVTDMVGWGKNPHSQEGGNVLFTDGSVEWKNHGERVDAYGRMRLTDRNAVPLPGW